MIPLLSVESVSKRHWRGDRPLDVLNDVSLELERGELAAVWGSRGAGKTTLLEIAAGLRVPDAGRVIFDGRDLCLLTASERSGLLHGAIGVATRRGPGSQDLPVAEWIAAVLLDRVGWRQARERATEVLERVGIAEVAGEPWTNLSDGDRTLAVIAHAVVRQPTLLLVDDLSAGLGMLERDEIMGLLQSLTREAGVSVLMTATELTDVQGARPVWSLGGGRLVGRGPRTAGTVLEFPARDARHG